jgi:uncharacterized protein DUF4261
MDLKDRFFGKGSPEPGGLPVANVAWPDPPSFQLLYPGLLEINADQLQESLRDYHAELARATSELIRISTPQPFPERAGGSPALLGLIAWGRHVVKMVGFDAPMPASVLDRTVGPAHYDPAIKEAAYAHASHILLFYAGYDPDVLEQHVALAAAAAALARFGAIVTLNETAHASVPAPVLLPHEEDGGDTLQAMRSLPLPLLYCGMVVIEPEGESGIWVRTYGCRVFKLPDLAIRPGLADEGQAIFELISNLLAHMRNQGVSFLAGDTIRAGDGRSLRVREPEPHEWFLKSEGRLLVVEPMYPEEAERR